MSGLFRPEVLANRQHAWLGKIQLIRPVSLALLTTLVAIIVVLIASYFFIGQYTKKARVVGYLSPDLGMIRIVPPQSAQLTEKRVKEGQQVRKGDVLFVLSTERTSGQGETMAVVQQEIVKRQDSLLDAMQQQRSLSGQQQAALSRGVADMERELVQLDQSRELQQQRLQMAEQNLARFRELLSQQFVSNAQVQQKAEEVLEHQSRLRAIERERIAVQRQIASARAELAEAPLRSLAQQGEISRSIAAVKQEMAENAARREILIRAPEDGTVTAVLAEVGQMAQPGAALASLVPMRAKLQAQLYAPSSAIGFVQPKQAVLLRYQAYPYQKFGHYPGQVLSVSKTPLAANDLANLPLGAMAQQSGEPLYQITVALDSQSVKAYGKPQSLQAGMQLEADVVLDKRRIVEWLFEPVLSVTGKV